jgi:hypothetical protein
VSLFWRGFFDGLALGPFWRWMARHFPDPFVKTLGKPVVTIVSANGEVVAVTMTDDEHRISRILWEKAPHTAGAQHE